VLGLERPPRWGLAALLALVLANGVLFSYLALRPMSPDPAAERSASAAQTQDAAPTSSASGTRPADAAAAQPPVLAVYGDGYSTGNPLGGQGTDGWPALVGQGLEADLRLHAVSRAGYAAIGTTGLNFAAAVGANPVPDADVTVVFGSRNDLGNTVAAVAASAAETLQLIRSTAPSTKLVVIGPAWSSADVPAELVALRDAVRAAAADADAVFVDPLADEWFSRPTGLIATDGISPTDAGHVYLAERILPVLQRSLEQATTTSAE
jgi:lysophospholipase L1-like esterase